MGINDELARRGLPTRRCSGRRGSDPGPILAAIVGFVDVKAVRRELRSSLWPSLRDVGFATRTERVAWRHWDGGVELIELTSIGSQADAVGCTTYSFDARVASVPQFLDDSGSWASRADRARPHYWNCPLMKGLHKTVSQPWFTPFSRPPSPTSPPSFRVHREALMRVLRRDVHDRPDIWFVREDGTNLAEVVVDLRSVFLGEGLAALEQWRDPCAVIAQISCWCPVVRIGLTGGAASGRLGEASLSGGMRTADG